MTQKQQKVALYIHCSSFICVYMNNTFCYILVFVCITSIFLLYLIKAFPFTYNAPYFCYPINITGSIHISWKISDAVVYCILHVKMISIYKEVRAINKISRLFCLTWPICHRQPWLCQGYCSCKTTSVCL